MQADWGDGFVWTVPGVAASSIKAQAKESMLVWSGVDKDGKEVLAAWSLDCWKYARSATYSIGC